MARFKLTKRYFQILSRSLLVALFAVVWFAPADVALDDILPHFFEGMLPALVGRTFSSSFFG